MTKTTLKTNYLLFDLDGTLVNSTPSVEQNWYEVVDRHNKEHPELQIDPKEFLKSSHGSRTEETFKKFFPYRDASVEAISVFENGIVDGFGHLAIEVVGALNLLSNINNSHHNAWAIVTSGTKGLAYAWFEQLFSKTIEWPTVFITANDVSQGKPHPEGYKLAAELLHKASGSEGEYSAIVFEDAPTGIRAGVSAGFTVVGISTTFSPDVLLDAGASYVIEDLSKVELGKDNLLIIELTLHNI